jgi:acylphosphatase
VTNSSAHVYVSGYVQGVFFRVSTARRARALRLGGWVRNLPDGRVEALFQGEEDAVRSMVEWCRIGPPHATVEALDVTWEQQQGEQESERFTRFEML